MFDGAKIGKVYKKTDHEYCVVLHVFPDASIFPDVKRAIVQFQKIENGMVYNTDYRSFCDRYRLNEGIDG